MTRRSVGFSAIGCLAAIGWIWLMLSKPSPPVHPSALRKPVRNVPAKIRTPLAALTDIATKERPPNEVSTPVAPDWLKRTPEGLVDLKTASTDKTDVLARLSGHSLPPLLPIDVESLLKLRQVHSVTVVPATCSERRIVHISNMHFVPKKYFFAGWKKEELDVLSKEDRNRAYEANLREVEAVQDEQEELLREMIQRLHVREIYGESITPENHSVLSWLRSDSNKGLHSARDQFQRQYGALGSLFLNRELDDILPAEDLKLLKAADTIRPDGSYHFDSEAHEKREDAMLECMMCGKDKDAVIVLGGAHDLTDNIQRQGRPCEYIRVTTKKYWEFSDKMQASELPADQVISRSVPCQ